MKMRGARRHILIFSVILCACAKAVPEGEPPEDATEPPVRPVGIDARSDQEDARGADARVADARAAVPDSGGRPDAGQVADAGPADASAARCDFASKCPTVRELGMISGDTGTGSLKASGTRSEWLLMRLTEDDGSFLEGVDVKGKFTLTSPTGANYDLFLYVASSDETTDVECENSQYSSSSAGSKDEISVAWSDNRPIGGADDSRNITVEVRHVSGTCTGGAWSLQIEGNTN
ncbi:MAG: hypothetical protein HY698_19105 [Deltaproteobacteria bacterium]|nr:hypothetical protein [Deltaproteobacteria bacterium]